nr:MAG TPA: hypothetical protein [Caudoviricetes sp.]
MCEIIYSIKKIIGTTRGGGHMRGGKQPCPCLPKNRNTCLISLRLAGKVIYRR